MSAILSPAQTADKPKLLDQVRDVIRRKHFSIRTEQTYVEWIKRYILFHGKRHPNEIAEAEILGIGVKIPWVETVVTRRVRKTISAARSQQNQPGRVRSCWRPDRGATDRIRSGLSLLRMR